MKELLSESNSKNLCTVPKHKILTAPTPSKLVEYYQKKPTPRLPLTPTFLLQKLLM